MDEHSKELPPLPAPEAATWRQEFQRRQYAVQWLRKHIGGGWTRNSDPTKKGRYEVYLVPEIGEAINDFLKPLGVHLYTRHAKTPHEHSNIRLSLRPEEFDAMLATLQATPINWEEQSFFDNHHKKTSIVDWEQKALVFQFQCLSPTGQLRYPSYTHKTSTSPGRG